MIFIQWQDALFREVEFVVLTWLVLFPLGCRLWLMKYAIFCRRSVPVSSGLKDKWSLLMVRQNGSIQALTVAFFPSTGVLMPCFSMKLPHANEVFRNPLSAWMNLGAPERAIITFTILMNNAASNLPQFPYAPQPSFYIRHFGVNSIP